MDNRFCGSDDSVAMDRRAPTIASIPIFLLALAAGASAAEKPQIDVQEFTLANGMKWLLYERHESPTIACGWTARVGSVNEHDGITGVSHLFEHMMFKGTKVIGTKDIKTDLALMAQQDEIQGQIQEEMNRLREQLRRGEIEDLAEGQAKSARYRELQKRFEDLVTKEREVIIKDEMDGLYTRNGGEALNAGTTEDFTVYYIRLPSNRLELWAWLESDRLLSPVFREFYSERDVVYEERRMRTEATPLGKYEEAFNALVWQASPYRWPVIGWPSDVSSLTKAEADRYFAVHYAPNNLTGVLVGDFKTAEVRPLLERYFGRIPRGRVDPPPVVTLEPKPVGEKRFNAEAETSPTVRVLWRGVPFVHKDAAALDLLSDVLSGRTGRLYKGLVLGRQLANATSASVDVKKYDGTFDVECTVKEGKDPAAAEAALYEEVERLQKEPVPPDELQKVKNEFKANAFRRLSSPFSILFQLMVYDALGDWRYINTSAERADAVTAEDLQRVARAYLTRETRTVGTFRRKGAAAPEKGTVHP